MFDFSNITAITNGYNGPIADYAPVEYALGGGIDLIASYTPGEGEDLVEGSEYAYAVCRWRGNILFEFPLVIGQAHYFLDERDARSLLVNRYYELQANGGTEYPVLEIENSEGSTGDIYVGFYGTRFAAL